MKPALTIYSGLMVIAIIVSLSIWLRIFRRDRRMIAVYLGALFGAVIGAKIVYLLAEGWMVWREPTMWQQWMTGKSILGALLGGYFGVELGKYIADYHRPTGDAFALLVPASVALGRVGCLVQGCCLGKVCPPAWYVLSDVHGVPRWPAVPVEMIFNLLCVACFVFLRRRHLLPGQHFHLYLMAYGVFRFLHEPLRDTPDVWGPITGYQIAAILVAMLGVAGFLRRRDEGREVAAA